ncbi:MULTISPECIES: phage head closure protein [unclassified Sedimentibacter]|uniref:phage head closure protein n=1 Tax=unclassified Sedimentibacter TaxID=2649220 RepID=UPI0027E02E85|nr:phage head closure protein [Sedimentibacter sp. MB35-C1]WMJ78478.1 phage head closure protein [Sedimentibacter sp. MB35-C1]
MTYDCEVLLIKAVNAVDEGGDTIQTETERSVLASKLDYRSKEFYQAFTNGLKPSITFAVNKYEYDNERVLKFEDDRYKIIDVYPVKAKDESEFESLALLCEAVV